MTLTLDIQTWIIYATQSLVMVVTKSVLVGDMIIGRRKLCFGNRF